MAATLNKVIEEFDALPFNEKEIFQDIVNKAMIEAARAEFRKDSEKALSDYKAGKLKGFKNTEDLLGSLDD